MRTLRSQLVNERAVAKLRDKNFCKFTSGRRECLIKGGKVIMTLVLAGRFQSIRIIIIITIIYEESAEGIAQVVLAVVIFIWFPLKVGDVLTICIIKLLARITLESALVSGLELRLLGILFLLRMHPGVMILLLANPAGLVASRVVLEVWIVVALAALVFAAGGSYALGIGGVVSTIGVEYLCRVVLLLVRSN
jgi:hypothetical protein